MSVYRIKKNHNYTVLSNYHFKEKTMSLKAKGLLSLMLSLPDDWDYSTEGLAKLSSDGITAVRSALQELEKFGYLVRERIRENGRISDWIYNIYEQPNISETQEVENQRVENQTLENNRQLNTKELNTKSISKDIDNKNTKNNNLNFFGSATKKPKQNLYGQCIALINDFTEDENIRQLLITYLGVRLEMDTPLGVKQWAGLLKKLKTLDNQEDVIQQSINRGYKGFFPVFKPSYARADNLHDRIGESGVRNVPHITQEELEEIERKVASGELRAY